MATSSAYTTQQTNSGGADLAAALKRNLDFTKVAQLQVVPDEQNVIVKVVNSNVILDQKPLNPTSGRGQFHLRISECLVGDDTGAIVFTARNEQVDLMKPGNTVILQDAEVFPSNGYLRLAVHQRDGIVVIEPAEFAVKEDNNLSLKYYDCEATSDDDDDDDDNDDDD